MTSITKEEIDRAFDDLYGMERSEMIRKFNESKVYVGPMKIRHYAESILAEAKKILDEVGPAYSECQAENERVLEKELIKEFKRRIKMEKRRKKMEETSLTDRLEKALRFKEELESKVRDQKN